MKMIGLLMVADEDDILDRTLEHNAQYVDCFYALDGTGSAEDTIVSHAKCYDYWTDAELPYEGKPRDGWRQHLLAAAYKDHGPDNWFMLMHGDEVWTIDPRDVTMGAADCYAFRLPFFFPRHGQEWQQDVHPLDQLRWALGPGWPEYRLFRGGPDVRYRPDQHFDVLPLGVQVAHVTNHRILHYPYRSPQVQRARAARHQQTRFDPDNYNHITYLDQVYWTDDMIAEWQAKPAFRDLHELAAVAA